MNDSGYIDSYSGPNADTHKQKFVGRGRDYYAQKYVQEKNNKRKN